MSKGNRAGGLARGLHVLVDFVRRIQRHDMGPGCDEDLLRLAELSPHLLADIGFQKDEGRSCDACQVWRMGPVVLELPAPD
ncbi:hypothetical protein TK43_01660 [Roseovarius sp. JS7-11]|nr:hypothetical protein TK43_01660 [Roseovarius sp. JS7-11]